MMNVGLSISVKILPTSTMFAFSIMRFVVVTSLFAIAKPGHSFSWHQSSRSGCNLIRSETLPLKSGQNRVAGGLRTSSLQNPANIDLTMVPMKKTIVPSFLCIWKLFHTGALKLQRSFQNYNRFMIVSIRHFWKRELALISHGSKKQADISARRCNQGWWILILLLLTWSNAITLLPQPFTVNPSPIVRVCEKTGVEHHCDMMRHLHPGHDFFTGQSLFTQQDQDIRWKMEGLSELNGLKFSSELDCTTTKFHQDLAHYALLWLASKHPVDLETETTPNWLKKKQKTLPGGVD
jgi:hypothetical protein